MQLFLNWYYLCVSKLEDCKLKLRLSALNLNTVIQQAISLSHSDKYSHLSVGFHIDPDVPSLVLIDGTRSKQILVNLISNGLKFTDCGGVTINVHRLPVSPHDEMIFRSQENKGQEDDHRSSSNETEQVIKLQFDVIDTGIGH